MTRPHVNDAVVAPVGETGKERGAPQRRHEGRWRRARGTLALYAAVALGSMIGGTLRAIASLAIHAQVPLGLPWATLFVNVTGSFVIGFYATLTGPDGRVFVSARRRQFIMTGICGGYTTFSLFSLETFRLAHAGQLAGAAQNVGISVVTWLAAVWLGHLLATRLNRLKGS